MEIELRQPALQHRWMFTNLVFLGFMSVAIIVYMFGIDLPLWAHDILNTGAIVGIILSLYEDVITGWNFLTLKMPEVESPVISEWDILAATRQHRRRDYGHGYVYVIRDIDVTGYCKIGRSIKPVNRIGDFFVKLPFSIKVECVIESDDCYQLESNLHRHFSLKHIRGEWFNLSDEDVQAIERAAAREDA